jgi:hypothetical protein
MLSLGHFQQFLFYEEMVQETLSLSSRTILPFIKTPWTFVISFIIPKVIGSQLCSLVELEKTTIDENYANHCI